MRSKEPIWPRQSKFWGIKAQDGLAIVGLAARLTIETFTLASGLAQFYFFEFLFDNFEELSVSSLYWGSNQLGSKG